MKICWTHSGIFGQRREWNPIIFGNMSGTGGHYVKWNKPDSGKTGTVCPHSHVEATIVDLLEIAVQMLGKMGRQEERDPR